MALFSFLKNTALNTQTGRNTTSSRHWQSGPLASGKVVLKLYYLGTIYKYKDYMKNNIAGKKHKFITGSRKTFCRRQFFMSPQIP